MSRGGHLMRFLVGCLLLVPSLVAAQPRIPLGAVLVHASEEANKQRLDAFLDGMRSLGYREGENYRLAMRVTANRIERLPALARELAALNPDVAVTATVVATQAMHRETRRLPIVMASGAGAQRFGLIESLARPGGRVTGMTNLSDALTAKLFELLQEVAPKARRVVALSSGLGAVEGIIRRDARDAAARHGFTLIEALADSPAALPALAERCRLERCEAMVAMLDPNLASFRNELVALARQMKVPAVYFSAEFVDAGGLVSYGSDVRDLYRRAAHHVDRILKGAKPGELPVEQPTRFELVVNVKVAQSLGLKLPATVLLRAERVIN